MKHLKTIIAMSFVFLMLVAATVDDTMTYSKAVSMSSTLGVTGVTTLTGGADVYTAFDSFDADGGKLTIDTNCVTTATDGAAGTETITGVIPAGAVSLGVTCRVDTVIAGAGAASFGLGDGVDADLYGTGIAFAEGTTIDTSDYTASPMTQAWSAAAGDLTMTANAGQFDSGSITCCSQYISLTAPTS